MKHITKHSILLVLFCAALAAHAQPGPGFALRINNTSSYVAVPQAVGLNSFPFTVMAWVNTSAVSGQQGLVNKYVASSLNGWNLFLRDGHVRAWYIATNTRFVWDGSDGLDGGVIANGVWHHVAFTVDGTGGKLYVDGVLRASRAWTGSSGPPSTAQEMRFGNYPGGILSFFGAIELDEISIWNTALGQSQVAANMFTPLVGNEANLVALYHCDEGGGSTVLDSAPLGGNNHGTWVSTPVFVPTVVTPQAASEGGSARGNCSGTPGITEVNLDWRGQNVVGCKVDLDWSRSRIRRVAPDCTTIYTADLPSSAPKRWTVLSQPIGSDIGVEVTATSARLPMPVAGNYTVQLEVCPGDCVVPGPDGNNFPMVPSTTTITIRAEAELPLRAQERPVLPPSAMVPTPRLALSESERACIAIGGGGFINPQWVTVDSWNGPNDYRLVEGAVVSAWPSTRASLLNHDLAFNGGDWYVINDVTMTISPDPGFFNLLSMKPVSEPNPHLLTCEAQYNTVPDRFCPVEGDRISLWGFWVIEGGSARFDTAIHPAVGWAVHRNRPIRIPDNAVFTFDLHSNTVVSTAGNNLYVPGVCSDLWFTSDTGGAIRQAAGLASSQSCTCHHAIVSSPIQRAYDFNIYLPKNPGQVFAEVGITKPRAPLHVSISNPYGSPGPDPTYTRMTETVSGVTYEYLRVHLDLSSLSHSNYSRRIEAAWVYPKADNWGLEQWRVSLDKLDVYDDLDSKSRFPGSDGDWVLWMMLPGAEQSWTRVRDGINNTHGTVAFSPAWQTGIADPVLQRAPLSLDPQRRLGPDVLTFNRSVNFWLGGFEADEAGDPDDGGEVGGDAGDPGRISGVVFDSGHSNVLHSHNGVFAATVTGTRVAVHSNAVLTTAATQLGLQYLLNCTNRINNRTPIRDSINPFGTPGLLREGISGELPLSPVDPQEIYGGAVALLDDFNGDGFPDVALGLRHSNAVTHIFLGGRNGFAPAPFAIASIPLVHSNFAFPDHNLSLVGAHDLSGDGIADLLVGAPTFVHSNAVAGVHSNAGTVFAFSGALLRAGGSFAHSNALWTLSSGIHSNAQFGFSIAAGDINGDHFSDVVVGAPFHSNLVATPGRPLGKVFIYFGSPGVHSNTPPSQTIAPPQLDIVSQHWFGYSVSTAGDVNHDGYTDVLIGAPRYTRLGLLNRGACYLYYGSPTGLVNNPLILEGGTANEQFGFSVAGAADVDGDGFSDILVGAPFASGSELTLENGYAALYRGSASGLIPTPAFLKYGETGGIHTGADVGPVGDLNGDGRGDIAIGTPDEISPEGLRGRVTYFLGHSNTTSITETFRTLGVNRMAISMCDTGCCVNKIDFNLDGFTDALTFSSLAHSTRVDRVQLRLGRGLKTVVPTAERFFRAGESEPFAFQSLFHSNFVADLVASGQTMEAKHSNVLATVQNLFLTVQRAGGDVSSLVPMLSRLQNVHSNLSNLGFVHSNLFSQFFANVDLDVGTAFYVDCGATNEYTDALGRRWQPDAPYLATSSSGAQLTVFTGIGPITNTLTGDRYLPDAMLNSERWFNGHIRYQVGVPNGWYTVILYFAENYPPAVSPALGGTGGATAARLFDLEVEGQRVNAYNQADAALPPYGDGFGRLYTATQVRFDVQVIDGLLDIAVLDRGPANPPENSAIKGFSILARPNPATKFATRPRIASTSRDGGQFSLQVDPQASLARYLAGEIPLRLQSTSNLVQWVTLPNLPEVGADGAFFTLPTPTNRANFFRAIVTPP